MYAETMPEENGESVTQGGETMNADKHREVYCPLQL